MKGIVFTEFQEMIESNFGLEMYDKLVTTSNLESNGAYTTVGTYDHTELLQMVVQLSQETDTPVPTLVKAFAHHFFTVLVRTHGKMLANITSSIELLANVEDYIHVEVRKLYPDAELPRFEFEKVAEDRWHVDYFSARPFADLAEGLIEAAAKHFDDPLVIEREDKDVPDGYAARFVLSMSA